MRTMVQLPIKINQNKIVQFCKKHHIEYFAFFGSVLTQKFTDNSDVDVLVRFEKKNTPTLFRIVDMETELSEIIGRSVDLKTLNELSPYFRNTDWHEKSIDP